MKILLITLEYPPFNGGVAHVYGHLLKFWPEPDNIRVLHNNDGKLLTRWLWPQWLSALVRTYFACRKFKCQHILVGHILPLGTVAYGLSLLTGWKYSVIMHGMDFAYAVCTPRKRRLTEAILRRADKIICMNRHTAALTEKFLGSDENITVVNPGIDPHAADSAGSAATMDALRRKYGLDGKTVVFSVSRLVKRKGFDFTIKAMAEVAKTDRNVHYFLAGDGPDKKYLLDCAQGIPNINFLGKITEEEKWAWLKLCDMFIMTPREIDGDFEGFGVVYLEAALSGKPVIASETGGVKDAVRGAQSGLMVDPQNSERIAGAILTLSGDAELRHRLGGQGREMALREFNWTGQAKKIFDIIHS